MKRSVGESEQTKVYVLELGTRKGSLVKSKGAKTAGKSVETAKERQARKEE